MREELPTCRGCRKAIREEEPSILADKRDRFHERCFVCAECGEALTSYVILEARKYQFQECPYYCEPCADKLEAKEAPEGGGYQNQGSSGATHAQKQPLSGSVGVVKDLAVQAIPKERVRDKALEEPSMVPFSTLETSSDLKLEQGYVGHVAAMSFVLFCFVGGWCLATGKATLSDGTVGRACWASLQLFQVTGYVSQREEQCAPATGTTGRFLTLEAPRRQNHMRHSAELT
ncbi:unnamed protein product [Symbiodinium microadriaticum]|nr:unnamed protein product [Symbiodinium microadriaticum]